MKIKVFIFTSSLLLATAFLSFSGTAQWVQTNGPYGPVMILSITTAPDSTIYVAGYETGLYRSTDNGRSFHYLPGSPSPDYIYISTAIGRNGSLFASIGSGTYRSTDKGNTWTRALSADLGSFSPMIADSEGNVFAGSSHGPLYRSTDNGDTWSQLNLKQGGYPIQAIGKNSNGDLFVGVATDQWMGRELHSSNNGDTWDTLHFPSNVVITEFVFSPGGHVIALFVSRDSSGVFLSSDNGITWKSRVLTTVYPDRTNLSIVFDRASGSFLAGVNGSNNDTWYNICRSTDFGDTWNVISAISYSDPICFGDDNHGNIFVSDGGSFKGGLMRSLDVGLTWSPLDSGFCARGCNALTLMPGGKISLITSNGTFHLSDSTNGWSPGGVVGSFLVSKTGNYFISDGGVQKSTDGGISWQTVFVPGGEFSSTDELSQLSNGYFLVGGLFYDGVHGDDAAVVWRSTDGGVNWSEVYWHQNAGTVYSINSLPNNIVLACDGSLGIVRSTDFGTTWHTADSGLPANVNCKIIRCNSGYVYAGTANGIFRSTDDGLSWNSTNNGLTSTDIRSIVFNSVGTVYTGTTNGVYRSTDHGLDWSLWNGGLIDPDVLSLLCDSLDYLYAGTRAAGVFRSVGPTTSVNNDRGGFPNRHALLQNYPNPFNPTTQISYTLPKESDVTLKVFDVLGREVTTLVNGKNQPGEHFVSWNALNVPSGVYFYRIVAGDFVQTKKMVLVK